MTAWLLLDASASMEFGPVERRKHLVLDRGRGHGGAAAVARGQPGGRAVLRQRVCGRRSRPATAATTCCASSPTDAAPRPRTPTAAGSTDLGGRVARRAGDLRRALARRDRLGLPHRARLAAPARPARPPPRRGAIQVVDRREFELPAAGMIYVEDAETGEVIFVDTDDPGFQLRLRAAGRRARRPRSWPTCGRPGSTCSRCPPTRTWCARCSGSRSCAGGADDGLMSFVWPWMLLALVAVPLLVLGYRRAAARPGGAACASWPRSVWSPRARRRPGWRRHVPPALLLPRWWCW